MNPISCIERNRQAITHSNHFDSTNFLRATSDTASKHTPQIEISWISTKVADSPVPIITLGSQSFALNSRYDPAREAERIARELESIQCIILIGWEAGYLTQALVREKSISKHTRILVIEPLQDLVRETLKNRDVSDAISDDRVRLAAVATESSVLQWLQAEYQVHFFSSVKIFVNQTSIRIYKDLGLDLEKWANAAVRSQQTDFLTQAHLGRRWMYNIFCNLSLAENSASIPSIRNKEILVLGAGPSSEQHVLKIKALQDEGAILFTSDAALAFCSFHGLRPDLVLSIDGQSISYIHLLENRVARAGKALVHGIDLCSHPSYGRENDHTMVLGSLHPFIQLLRQHGLSCGHLDTAGGNVGYSLMKLATESGPRRVHAFGLDFSYASGKPYVRPSFYYSSAIGKTNRLSPFEQSVAELWIDHVLVPMKENEAAYQTHRMQWYAETFHKMIEGSHTEIVSYCPTWTSLSGNVGQLGQSVPDKPSPVGSRPPSWSIVATLQKIDRGLEEVIATNLSAMQIWNAPKSETRDVLMSLLPLLAWHTAFLLKTDPENTDIVREALHNAASETRVLISNFFGEV